MEPTNHRLQIMSSKCGLGTKPMWSGWARAAPEVVTAAGSKELEYLEAYFAEGLDDELLDAAKEAEVE
jgi:hypothetical protein